MKWLRRVAIALAIVILLCAVPIAYVELRCTATPDLSAAQTSPFAITEPGYRRAVGDSYLTYPEWNIVYAYDDFAAVARRGSESDFGYLQSIRSFWTSLCAVKRVAPQHVDQRLACLRLELTRHEPVLRPHQAARDQGRPRIGLELSLRIEGANDVHVRLGQCDCLVREARLHQPRDPRQPLAAAARLVAVEIIEAGTRMGVDDAEGGRLVLQVSQDARQRDVLDDIGEVAGVEGVAIVHGAGASVVLRDPNPLSLRAQRSNPESFRGGSLIASLRSQ